MYDDLVDGKISVEEAANHEALQAVSLRLEALKSSLKSSRTAKLFMQYSEMVSIFRKFLKAERTGDWDLYLSSLSEMLPYLAAAGHNLYAKSVRLFLQMMQELETSNPQLFGQFASGKFIARRSDRYWAGLAPDLVIETVLMKSLKTDGGLTRGKGMTELQRNIWTMSMPVLASVNDLMQKLTGLEYSSSEQHVTATAARIKRDTKDLLTFLEFLLENCPFTSSTELRSIGSGLIAQKGVNAEDAKAVGELILQRMDGQSVESFSFRKKDKVVTLASDGNIRIDGEILHIDPALLFQRLSTAAHTSENDMAETLRYELCSYPPALFENSGIMRQPDKPALAKAIWKEAKTDSIHHLPVSDRVTVVDGGWLLQQVPWKIGDTYDSICDSYVSFVTRRCTSPTVVFDGYSAGPTTKDATHNRRCKGSQHQVIDFSLGMKLQKKKEEFLSNSQNKQRIISYIGEKLRAKGFEVVHAKDDADYLIVKTAVTKAENSETIVLGNDTDLLILLLYHLPPNAKTLYFESSTNAKEAITRFWCLNEVKKKMGEVSRLLLVGHALLGCDTTSRVFGLGKQAVLPLLKKSEVFRKKCEVFLDESSSKDEIVKAGEYLLLSLYKARPNEDLTKLRHRIFLEKVSSSNTTAFVKPERLPPTEAAASFHSQRVRLQVSRWKGEPADLDPADWGWVLRDHKYSPVMTDLLPAPQTLLSVVRCNCKTGCENSRCSCKKNGLACTFACGECQGINCLNRDNEIVEDEELD